MSDLEVQAETTPEQKAKAKEEWDKIQADLKSRERPDWKELRADWFTRAKDIKPEGLQAFMQELMTFRHDYNTVCYAVAACGIAAMNTMNRCPEGGITGFQAGAVMWEVIREWGLYDKEAALRILNYENLLYPQHEDDFTTISVEVWKQTQEKAKVKLAENPTAHPLVIAHWQSIVDNFVPFGLAILVENKDDA